MIPGIQIQNFTFKTQNPSAEIGVKAEKIRIVEGPNCDGERVRFARHGRRVLRIMAPTLVGV